MTLPMSWQPLYRHWVRDPFVGARLIATHEALRAMPTDALSNVGGRLGRFAGPRYPAADQRARTALAALRPDLAATPATLDRTMARVWDSVGRAYAEFSAEDRIYPEGRVAVEGLEHVAAARASGRPLIVAGVHLGNWEMIPISLLYQGHTMTAIYQPQRNRFQDRIARRTRLRMATKVAECRPEAGLRLLAPSPGAGTELLRALRTGRTLMIYADESIGGRVHAPLLGRPVRTDSNLARIARLARIAEAAVIPAYAQRTGGARFTVRFGPPLPFRVSADRGADLESNIALLDTAVTEPILAHVDQWFMLPDLRLDR